MEMRVYAVPAEQTRALVNTLNSVFGAQDGGVQKPASLGRVSSPAPGQLVVLAPASLQASIEASLHALSSNAPPRGDDGANAEAPLRLSLWIVDALPGNGADGPSLAILAPALDEVRKTVGAAHFALRDMTEAVSRVDAPQPMQRSWVGSDSQQRSMRCLLTRRRDGYALDMMLSDMVPAAEQAGAAPRYTPSQTSTNTSIRTGQTLVLAQSPLPAHGSDPGGARLYIIRVDAIPAG